jgi:hypothetical protein
VIHDRFQSWREAGVFDNMLMEMVRYYAGHWLGMAIGGQWNQTSPTWR